MYNNKKIEDVLIHIHKQGFNRFIMSNNVNNEKILAFGFKYTTEPNINICCDKIEKLPAPELMIEVDRSHDESIGRYVEKLCMKNKLPLYLSPTKFSFVDNTFSIEFGKVVLNITCEIDQDITTKARMCDIKQLTLFEIFNIECIKYLTKDNVLLFDMYKLGDLTPEVLNDLKISYFYLLNGFYPGVNKSYKTYHRSSTPYCKIHNNQVFIGLWDNYKNKIISRIKVEEISFKKYLEKLYIDYCDTQVFQWD